MFEKKEGSSLFFNMQINLVKNYDIHASNFLLVLFHLSCIKTAHFLVKAQYCRKFILGYFK